MEKINAYLQTKISTKESKKFGRSTFRWRDMRIGAIRLWRNWHNQVVGLVTKVWEFSTLGLATF